MPGGGLEFNCEKPKEQMEDLGISYYQCFFTSTVVASLQHWLRVQDS